MSSTESDIFNGWAGTGKGKPLERMQLSLRRWDEDCVDINITHCGVCASDLHCLDQDDQWGPTDYPCVVGHEIVGVVARVGKNVSRFKVGDRVGVGAQCTSCHECDECNNHRENLCPNFGMTYNARWPNGDKTYGGYADKWRGDHRFVFKIPDHLSSEVAATFFCAGITSYSPLKRTGVNEDSVVGIMGIGGLGHYGILWAKAMGAKVVAISTGDRKRNVSYELGCDDFIDSTNPDDMARYEKKFTHILCTGCSPDFQWSTYLNLIRGNGYFLNVNAPAWELPPMPPFMMLMAQVFIQGSCLGSPVEIEEMLKFAEQKNVRPWITMFSMKDVNKVLEDFRAGKPRFRFVLEN
ncbi:NADP-dependent alcohol dehydrogenase C 2 [Choanephora cucurbitarum]|uniref:NADP-dependent alcohol dehydrogenase C 2 n=1 Tax=Choanephora cucurbitarum TaxID=101091 RepID=A0A1C7N8E8_9FUNG|nr:NADP-dependent alcohol dehydrogenase C 2 [Choanephora cucurbitarum]